MTHKLTRRDLIRLSGAAVGASLLAACAGNQKNGPQEVATNATAQGAASATSIDYLVLVNKQHKIPDGWQARVDWVEAESLLGGDPLKVERKTYEAFKALKKDLEADGAFVELASCYRSVAQQQELMDESIQNLGAEYAKRTVATPGYSEHHTGLSLDLFLEIEGENITEQADMLKHPEIWEKVHAKLADHGFILRYPSKRKLFTGYSYEPWHIRYLNDPNAAKQIMDQGLTLEEYLDQVPAYLVGCEVDYGTSSTYVESDIDATIDVVLGEFSTWEGCVLKRFAYAGDDACGNEELAYVNSLRNKGFDEFKHAIVVITDFHTPSGEQASGTAWEANTDYEGYTWHLGRTDEGGGWQLMSWGYA